MPRFGAGQLNLVIDGTSIVLDKVTATQWTGFTNTFFEAGQTYTVRLFQAGTETGITADGLKTIGDRKNPDEDLIPENFYSVDPETGPYGLKVSAAKAAPECRAQSCLKAV